MELSQPSSLMFAQGNRQVSPPDSTYPVADFDSGIKIDLISTSSKIQIKPRCRVPWAPCIKDFASECNRNCATISSPGRFWPGEGLMSANCIKITWRPTQPFLRTKHPTRRLWISICPVLITGSGRGCGVVYNLYSTRILRSHGLLIQERCASTELGWGNNEKLFCREANLFASR